MYLTSAFVLMSTLSFLVTKSHWSDFLQSMNFILLLNCMGASFVEQEKRRGGFLYISFIFTLILSLNFVHFIYNGSIAGMAGNQNWFAALISACLPFSLYLIYQILTVKFSKLLAALVASLVVLPTYFYCIYHAEPRATYAALILVFIILVAKYVDTKKFLISFTALLLVGIIALAMNPKKVDHQIKKFKTGDVRLPLWEGCADMIGDSVFFGVGQNNFGTTFAAYDTVEHKKHFHHPDEVTHPHNEFLLIAIENGAPAALAFLLLCLLILKQGGSSRDPMDIIFFIGFFILIVQGFVDKALYMPPTSMMVAVCAAFNWRSFMMYKRCDGCFKHKKYLRLAGFFVALLISWQSFIELSSAMNWRESQIIFKQKYKERYVEGEERLKKAIQLEPRKLVYSYGLMKAYLSPLNKPKEGLELAQEIYKKSPHYIQINRNLGHLYLLNNDLIGAEKYYTQNLSLHPWSVVGYLDLANIKTRLGKSQDALKCLDLMEQVYKDKFTLDLFSKSKNLEDERKKWLSHTSLKNWYSHSQNLISRVAYKRSKDLFFNKLKEYENLSYYYDTNFNTFDVQFWNDMRLLNDLIQGIDEADKILSMISKTIQIEPKGDFLYPGEVLRKKSSEPLSYACLMIAALRQRGISSAMILKGNQLSGLIIHTKGKNWFCGVGKSKLIEFNSELYKDSSLYAFVYPQEVALRNHLLSNALNADGKFFQMAVWPIMEIQKFNLETGYKIKDVLPLPFKKMSDALTKMMN